MMQIGERMKAYRKMRGLSIQKLAELSGVSGDNIYNYESGKHIPGIMKVLELADAYDISIDEYLGRRTKQVNLESFTTDELLGEMKRRLDGKVSW